MRNKIFIVFYLLLGVSAIKSENIYKDSYITLRISENITIEPTGIRVVTDNKDYYLHIQYSLKYNSDYSNLLFSFKLKKDIDYNNIMKVIYQKEIIYTPSPFGMGRVLITADKKGYTHVTDSIKRYASEWGTFATKDLLIYHRKDDRSFYSEYLIELTNIWPMNSEIPYEFTNKTLDEDISLKKDDYVTSKYIFLDELFSKNLEVFDFNKIFNKSNKK